MFLALVALVAGASARGQAIVFGKVDPTTINTYLLREETVSITGYGNDISGIGLLGSRARHWLGDSSGLEARDLVDSTWVPYRTSQDSVLNGSGVHWVRVRLLPDASLRDVPLVLMVRANRPFEVFLNGRSLLKVDPSLAADTGTPRYTAVPMRLACDGRMEALALRIEGSPGTSLLQLEPLLSVHLADVLNGTHRLTMHYGVFVGINAIIVLLALVMGRSERKPHGWHLLAALAAVAAVGTVADMGSDQGLLGLSSGWVRALDVLGMLLVPWPLYLLIRVLDVMGLDLGPRRRKLYLMAVITVTVICGLFLLGEEVELIDGDGGLAFRKDVLWLLIPGFLAIAVFGIIVAWFSIEVVRLGIRLMRTKSHVRWIGAGAVASSLFALVLNVVSVLSGLGFSSWLNVVAEYCFNVAVPVSVAVYMAVRAAHHNRLVARQRDELDKEVQERTAELRTEKERSDALLLNILPAEVAEELKAQGSAAARHFDHASVLFTDFKGFTTLAAQVDPARLLAELNTCFKAFDDIIGARGIEKIKTIGDAYMCAGGLPDPKEATAADVVYAALEMQEFMQRRKLERDAMGQPAFDMRVGIHTGPVVAGIVGVKKFQYDIWGDTVNTASRMESSGEVRRVNISRDTYEQVKNEPGLRFVPRGLVEVKGKGELEMFFVERAQGASASTTPA